MNFIFNKYIALFLFMAAIIFFALNNYVADFENDHVDYEIENRGPQSPSIVARGYDGDLSSLSTEGNKSNYSAVSTANQNFEDQSTDGSLNAIYSMLESGDKVKAIRYLEDKFKDPKTNEADAINIAGSLANMATNESRLDWITSQLQKKLMSSEFSLNHDEVMENVCTIISSNINPAINGDLSVSYANYCVSLQPRSDNLKYNLALTFSNIGKDDLAISAIASMKNKSDESLFFLWQIYARNSNNVEAEKYANLLRQRKSSLANDLPSIDPSV